MEVQVTKPVNGTVTLTVDDRRGSTGMRLVQRNVPVAAVREQSLVLIEQWAKRHREIRAARKGRPL